jgi:uncharacterized hydrophobic protein (TIGR00271 family)
MKEIFRYFQLSSELEQIETIHANIEKDIIFKGTNLWILVFAIIVASVGLNMNSTAVIIGAMLISPLMGPINGLGYGLATYNFPLFRRAAKNLGFAVGASLAASTLYFVVSPVSSAHSEILARTTPTIYDVMIALFGGMAGILALSTRNKGNILPGVAIATALMPPLCTAGYGLATGQIIYFFGAFYLFIINAVFIALSSLFICRFLKFPAWTDVDSSHKKRVSRLVSAVILLTVVPSIYLGYGLVKQEQFTENANRFTKNLGAVGGSYLLKSDIKPVRRIITLVFGGTALTEADKKMIHDRAVANGLSDANIDIQQGFAYSDLSGELTETERLTSEISALNQVVKSKEFLADSLTRQVLIGKELLLEIRQLFPSISACSYAQTARFSDEEQDSVPMAIVTFRLKGKPLRKTEVVQIRNWVKARLKTDEVGIYFE